MLKNFTTNISAGVFWTILLPLALIVIVVGSGIGMVIVDHVLMPRVASLDRNEVIVPAVTGMSFEAAREKMYSIGLRLQIETRSYSEKIAQDIVISQSIKQGERSKKGTPIPVVLSRGPATAAVPDVRTLNERAARAELRKAGFDIRRIKLDHTDDYAKDLVCNVWPPPGTVLSRDSSVDLTLSLGSMPTSSLVPNIVGETLDEARTKLNAAELEVGVIEYRSQSTVAHSTVLSQSRAPGATVPLGSKINLVLSQ